MSSLAQFFVVSGMAAAGVTFVLGVALVIRKGLVVSRTVRTSRHAGGYRHLITRLLLEEETSPGGQETLQQWRSRHGTTLGRLSDELHRPWSGSRRQGLLEVLRETSRIVRGETLDRVTMLYEHCGYVGEALRDLRSRRWWIRARACRDLGAMRSRRALFALLGRLQDSSDEVRQEASLALVQIVGAGEALGAILQEVREINPWFALRLSVAVNAAAPEALEHLVGALSSPYASVQRFAVIVLGEVKDPATVPVLLSALHGAANHLRAEILSALGKIGDARALPALLAGLEHPDGRVRRSALAAIGDLGSPAAAGHLVAVIRSAEMEERREAAAALVRLRESLPRDIRDFFPEADAATSAVLQEALDDAGVDPPEAREIAWGAA